MARFSAIPLIAAALLQIALASWSVDFSQKLGPNNQREMHNYKMIYTVIFPKELSVNNVRNISVEGESKWPDTFEGKMIHKTKVYMKVEVARTDWAMWWWQSPILHAELDVDHAGKPVGKCRELERSGNCARNRHRLYDGYYEEIKSEGYSREECLDICRGNVIKKGWNRNSRDQLPVTACNMPNHWRVDGKHECKTHDHFVNSGDGEPGAYCMVTDCSGNACSAFERGYGAGGVNFKIGTFSDEKECIAACNDRKNNDPGYWNINGVTYTDSGPNLGDCLCEVNMNTGFFSRTQKHCTLANSVYWTFGYCLDEYGRDQQEGQIILGEDQNISIDKCREKCRSFRGATGCEMYKGKTDRAKGCYVHTRAVHRGDGNSDFYCWVFSETQY